MNEDVSESLTGSIEVDFPEYLDPPSSPFDLLASWIKRAVRLGVREPLAMALATSGASRRPSLRTVVLAELTTSGVLFSTHSTSRKGREIDENPQAACLLYWRETSEQVLLTGPVSKASEQFADEMWNSRNSVLHPMSVASHQSEILTDVEALRRSAERLAERSPLQRPDSYRVYELRLDEIEFWANGRDRLHERLWYRREGRDWQVVRLQP